MSEAFTIRPATPDDDAAMAELEHASAIYHATIDPDRWRVPPVEDVAASRRFWRAAEPRSEALVAEASGQVIGMIELWLRRPKDRKNARPYRVEVHLGISVAPAARGGGVGTALMLAGEAWARAHGAERMQLSLDSANTGALRLYERLGYEVHGHEMDKVISPDPGTADDPAAVRNIDGDVVPTLRGAQVTLRPIRDADRAALLEVLRDPSVVEVWDTRGAEGSVDELLAGDKGWTVWAIEADGEFAGSIQATEEPDGDYEHAGIDIFMSSRFQGRGLGTDAVRTLAALPHRGPRPPSPDDRPRRGQCPRDPHVREGRVQARRGHAPVRARRRRHLPRRPADGHARR